MVLRAKGDLKVEHDAFTIIFNYRRNPLIRRFFVRRFGQKRRISGSSKNFDDSVKNS